MVWITSIFTGDTMRERINRLARGIVEGESPVLQIEPQSVKDSVPAER